MNKIQLMKICIRNLRVMKLGQVRAQLSNQDERQRLLDRRNKI